MLWQRLYDIYEDLSWDAMEGHISFESWINSRTPYQIIELLSQVLGDYE